MLELEMARYMWEAKGDRECSMRIRLRTPLCHRGRLDS